MSALTPSGSTRRWRRLRRFVLERDAYRCQLPVIRGGTVDVCGAHASHVDHVVPRLLGGGDDLSNLRASCSACNLRRGAGGSPVVLPDPPGRPRFRW